MHEPLDFSIVEELISAQSALYVFVSANEIGSFLAPLIRRIPGVRHAAIQLDGGFFPLDAIDLFAWKELRVFMGPATDHPMVRVEETHGGERLIIFPCSIGEHLFGHVLVVVNIAQFSPEGQSLISNLANALSITLENRMHKRTLEETNARFRRLLSSSNSVPWEADLDSGRITWVGEQVERVLGFTQETFLGYANWLEMIHPDDRDWFSIAMRSKTLEGGHHDITCRMLDREGRTRYLFNSIGISMENGRAVRLTGVMTDISEKISSMEALRKSEEKYRTLFNRMRNGFALLSLVFDAAGHPVDWTFLDVNPGFELLTRLKQEQLVGRNYGDIMGGVPPELLTRFAHVVEVGDTERFEWLDDRISKSFKILAYKLEGDRFAVVIEDITEQRSARMALAAEHHKIDVMLRSIADGVLTTTAEGQVDFCNRAAQDILNRPSAEILGRSVEEVFQISPVEAKSLVTSGEEAGLKTPLTKQLFIGGRVSQIEVYQAQMKDEEGNVKGHAVVFRDVTDLRRSEEALRHAHKMEAIGTLAGGIAHEFNNVLGIILGNVEMAMEDFSEPPLQTHLDEIRGASFRAREIVRQLLNFSKTVEASKQALDPTDVIDEAMKLIRASLPATITVEHRIEGEIRPIRADSTQIHQVMFNLASNAAQAMADDGGELLVTLESRVVSGSEAARVRELKAGEYTIITVRDTGEGIPAENMEKIFDPYFTTRPSGQGTGMGLSVVHSIVRNHGGAITCHSVPGEHATFAIYLPVSTDEVRREPVVFSELPTGTEAIMLVDDEVSLTSVGKLLLQKLGYSVTVFNHPSKALKAFTDTPDAFDLVITDMTMPEMTGDRLATRFWALRPNLPIILCTGFTERLSREEALRMGMREYLPKPFDKLQLARAVRTHLDAMPQGTGK